MRKKRFNEREIKVIQAAAARLSKLTRSLDLETLKLNPKVEGGPGFAFKHAEFVIKAIFRSEGIEFKSNVMSIRCSSITQNLTKNKDLMKMYLLWINKLTLVKDRL